MYISTYITSGNATSDMTYARVLIKGPGHSGAGLTGPEPFWVPKG